MKVSVITTVLNGADTLPDAFESLWAQDYPDIEHVVIDGGSTDGTVEFVNAHRDRVGYFSSEPDNGLYDAFNKGIQAASGDLVGFLHADDLFASPTIISELVSALQTHKATMVYGDLNYVDRTNPDRIIRHWRSGAFSRGVLDGDGCHRIQHFLLTAYISWRWGFSTRPIESRVIMTTC